MNKALLKIPLGEGQIANFRYPDLRDVQLDGAVLKGGNFCGANLTRANLSGGNFCGADFSYSILFDTNLSGADLSGADFSKARAWCANFSGANLSFAKFSGADLRDVQLDGAVLKGGNFCGADLGSADMRTKLDGVDFSDAIIDENTRFDIDRLTAKQRKQLGIS
ncbi:MAG: pentapeptide repeat-containing protein [bacterium]|nr:pentapeptide repeat-containing protein [bacterium]